MLASSGPVAAPATAWAFEPKLDGWRVLVSVDGDSWCARATHADRRCVCDADLADLRLRRQLLDHVHHAERARGRTAVQDHPALTGLLAAVRQREVQRRWKAFRSPVDAAP